MSEKDDQIPDDIFDSLIEFGLAGRRQARQHDKDEWVRKARALFDPTDRRPCCICLKHQSITHAHHVVPLARQFDLGYTEPDHVHVWLCPNHHAIVHLFLSPRSSANQADNFGGVLEWFSREELVRLHTLLMKSGVAALKP